MLRVAVELEVEKYAARECVPVEWKLKVVLLFGGNDVVCLLMLERSEEVGLGTVRPGSPGVEAYV